MRGGRIRYLPAALILVVGLLASALTETQGRAADTDDHPVEATNAVVIDADTGRVLFERGMDEAVPPASLTKIFTAIVALESAAPDTSLTVDPYDLVGEASIGLHAGEEASLETLLYGLMLTSGNDAAMTIARELGSLPGDSPQESVSRFVERTGNTADRLGLKNTNLRNPHGLDQDGHTSSAADIAAMSMYAINNPVFKQIISTPYHAGDGREFYNVNMMLDGYPGLVGGKTGVTSKAGYCLMQVAERNGKSVIVVLLGSTAGHWFSDAEYLLNFGFEQLEQNPDDETRPVVGLASAGSINVPEVADESGVGGGLTVDRLSDHEAVVRSSSSSTPGESLTWRWPLVSIGMMGVALFLALNFPAILGLGALAVQRGAQIRLSTPPVPRVPVPSLGLLSAAIRPFQRAREQPRVTQRDRTEQPSREPASPNRWNPRPRSHVMTREHQTITLDSPARSRAEQAIKLAMQSRYHAATEEFRRALEIDPEIDLTKCPGFWRMQPMGYISAAKGYKLNDQIEEARRLLTVVQLAFKSNRDLSRLLDRAIRALDY